MRKAIFYIVGLGILAGFILTTISWLKLCQEACSDAHNYRIFGLPFEWIGWGFFSLLAFFHFTGRKALASFLIVAALGAEVFLILFQKYQLGTFCPVCLSIAGVIGIIALCYIFIYKLETKGNFMLQAGLLTALFIFGMGGTFFGITKIDQLEAAEDAIKQKIVFGNPLSPVQVYVFTDWECPACRLVEPAIEAMSPKIMQEAGLTFVDTVVHPATLNYAPYDLSFMVYNKPQYFKIREALGKLALKTKKPTEEEVVQTISPLNVRYIELPYEDVTLAMRHFDELTTKFKVTATPTVAIVNATQKKGKKLAGAEEITEANLLKAIHSLK